MDSEILPSRSWNLARSNKYNAPTISVEQENEEGSALRTDPSSNQGNFNS